jgi:amino acid transporter
MKGRIIKIMLTNFLIWLAPTALFLVVAVGVLAILLMASADLGSSSSDKKDPFEKWPKGFIGSLGIGFCIVCVASLASFFYFENLDAEGIIYIIVFAIICSMFGYWGVKYDYKRLRKALESAH